MSNCHSCAYKQNVPGDAHIACSFNHKKAGTPVPRGNQHGINNGWYMFPVNYDPNWMVDECLHYSEEKDPEFVIEPFESLFQLMRP